MKVKFTEGSFALDVPEVGRVERGETVEVSDELGKQLLEQGWERVGGSSKKNSSKKNSSKTTTPEPGPNEEGK